MRHQQQQPNEPPSPPQTPISVFTAISKIIDAREMIGYVDTHLTPHDEPNTVKYEINGTSLTLSSCLTFPNGKNSQCRNEGVHEKGIVMTSSSNIVRGSKGIGVGGGLA